MDNVLAEKYIRKVCFTVMSETDAIEEDLGNDITSIIEGLQQQLKQAQAREQRLRDALIKL